MTTTDRPEMHGHPIDHTSHEEIWRTVSVTALPLGWRNVFRQADGPLVSYASPALLLQEHIRDETRTYYRKEDGKPWISTEINHMEKPFVTRVIFAHYLVDDCELEVPNASSSYVGTIEPGADPATFFTES